MAYEPAIVGYRKAQRFDDALRIVMPFPHLPASKTYLKSPGRASHAVPYLEDQFRNGPEPHNASYALAVLYEVQNDLPRMREWATTALAQDKQHQKRQDDLRRMLAR